MLERVERIKIKTGAPPPGFLAECKLIAAGSTFDWNTMEWKQSIVAESSDMTCRLEFPASSVVPFRIVVANETRVLIRATEWEFPKSGLLFTTTFGSYRTLTSKSGKLLRREYMTQFKDERRPKPTNKWAH